MKRIFHTGHFYLHPARQHPALSRRDGRIDCMAPARDRNAPAPVRHSLPSRPTSCRCLAAHTSAPVPAMAVRRCRRPRLSMPPNAFPIRPFMPRPVYGVAPPCGRCRISRAPAVKTMHGCRIPATVHSLRSMIGVVSAPQSSFDRLAPAFEKLGLAAADKVHDFGQAVRELLEILLV